MPLSPLSGRLIALTDKRRLIYITGGQAAHFLTATITADIAALTPGVMTAAALLSPQGKILFDFLIAPMPAGAAAKTEQQNNSGAATAAREETAGFLLDIAAAQAEAFARRLSLYTLRAQVYIAPPQRCIIGVFSADAGAAPTPLPALELPPACFTLRDSRFPAAAAVCRAYYQADSAAFDQAASQHNWNTLRLAHAVPESGQDFTLAEMFPHDVNYDGLGAIVRQKGCYIGQEIVARMQHKAEIRKRLLRVEAEQPLPPPGTDIIAEGRFIGRLGTVSGRQGLAVIRIDKIPPAGHPAAQAGGVALHFTAPAYLPAALAAAQPATAPAD